MYNRGLQYYGAYAVRFAHVLMTAAQTVVSHYFWKAKAKVSGHFCSQERNFRY